jgi:hypothetical protein
MRIVVDRLPDNGKDCLFSILYKKYEDNKGLKSNCKLRMKQPFDYEYMSFSYGERDCTCLLDLGKECPYLALECL